MALWVDIAGIEKSLYDEMKTLCPNVFVNNAPKSAPTAMGEFVVVNFGSAVYDRNAYKESYATIYLFVRNKRSSVENSARIAELSNKILTKLPIVTEKYSLTSPSVSYGTLNGEFTQTTIRCELLIK